MKPLTTGKSMGRSRKKLTAWLALVMLVAASLACVTPTIQLPGALQPPPTMTAQVENSPQTIQAQPAASTPQSQVKLAPTQANPPASQTSAPPSLIEAQPVPGSMLDLQSSLTLYFDQPMDTASVEKAFELQPPAEGKFDWVNNATLRFTPAQPLPASTVFRVVINASARSTTGKNLVQGTELTYQTVDPLQAREKLPANGATDVSPAAAVVASFNRPVVPLVGEAANLPQGFTLQPDAKGRGEWVNTSTYIFYPQPPLSGGMEYTVKVNVDLGIAAGQDWSFKTTLPALVSAAPDNTAPAYLDAPVVLKFNQPMDAKSVEANFRLAAENGEAAPGSFSWNQDSSQVTFQPGMLLARGARYTVTVAGQAQSQGGTPLGGDISSSFTTVGNPDVISTRPAENEPLQVFEGGYAGVTLNFNVPLGRKQNFANLVQVDPAISGINVFLGPDDNNLVISGYFLPSTQYTISLSSTLQDRWGQAFGSGIKRTFNTSTAPAGIQIPMLQVGTSILFITPEEKALKARVTNVLAINTSSSNLSIEDFIRQANSVSKDNNIKLKSSWRQEFNLPPNQTGEEDLQLTSLNAPLSPGLYYFQITSPELTGTGSAAPGPFLVVSSDIQMVIKHSATGLFIWAVDLRTYEPVKAAKVTIYDAKGQALGDVETDQQGIGRFALPEGMDPYAYLYAVTGQPGDSSFSLATTAWNQGVQGYDFGLNTSIADNQPMVYLYTDRPIYRPGQKVYFKAVARKENNGRYSLLDLKELNIKVTGGNEGETPLTSQALPLSAFGTAHGEFTLPADTPPGVYTFSVAEAKDSYLSIQVANYRKPEIDLGVQFDQSEGIAGQKRSAQVKATYYFGAPAGGLTVTWSLYANRANFSLPEEFQTGKLDTSWLQPPSFGFSPLGVIAAQGQGETLPDGTMTIELPADVLAEKLDLENAQQLTLEVTAQDESRQPVSARASTTIYPANFFIGVRSDTWSGSAGTEAGFNVQTVDLQKNPSGNHKLTARFLKATWTREDPPGLPIGAPNYRMDTSEVSSTDFATDQNGRARIAFTPDEPGTYMVEVRGEGAVTQVLFWVGGAGSAPWPSLPNQRLNISADSASYTPGQTANIFIANPYKQGALALITVERAKVMSPLVMPIDGASKTVQLPLTEDYAPNVYVSVTLLGRQDDGQPDFRQGYVELDVKPVQEVLQVQLTPSAPQLTPDTQAGFSIEVKDSQGQPVQGEFSLALVDKAALALADPNGPDINEAFYGRQPLGVQSSLSLAAFAQRIPLMLPGRGGGGGGFPEGIVRQNFLDTAYWNAEIQTDSSGKAQVTAALPDNLTTWVADLRGITKGSRTGEAKSQVVTSKELLIRPVTPRFFVVGDHIRLTGIVQNNTGQALKVDARLQATGFELDDPGQATQTVNVPANGRQAVDWWGTAQDVDAVDLIFSAQSGGLEDNTRPEAGQLPVLHYSAPESFGTTGVLDQAGERTERVSLPRSFTPTGGALTLEMSPSLASSIVSGLQVLDSAPDDMPEAAISRLLPNLAAYQVLKDLGADPTNLLPKLDEAVRQALRQVIQAQNFDGGWGWAAGGKSDPYISAYILFGLSQASRNGMTVPPQTLSQAQNYLSSMTQPPSGQNLEGQLDQMVFQTFALKDSGAQVDANPWYDQRENLQPWSKALLALMLRDQTDKVNQLVQEVQASRVESATGVHWEEKALPGYRLSSSPIFVTAVVTYALAQLDPANPVLVDATRYLTLNRQPRGGWSSTYDSAWVLLALTEALKGTGDLQANYKFSAQLNGKPLASGQAGGANTLNPIQAQVPLTDLAQQPVNTMTVRREAGTGRLYYRAYLQVNRPVDSAPAINKGVAVDRSFFLSGQDCGKDGCPAITSVKLGSGSTLLTVRVTVNLAHDASHLVVEDNIPAGTEILNKQLNTSQQGVETPPPTEYDPEDPYKLGWGWWLFSNPQVYDNHIRWTAENVPAGTYQLTYTLVVLQAGEYRLIPARAYEYYFPEVQGSSAGTIFSILP